MKFLLDANMPRAALHTLIEADYEAEHVRDIGLGDATDARIYRHAQDHGLSLVTRDIDFCDIRTIHRKTRPDTWC